MRSEFKKKAPAKKPYASKTKQPRTTAEVAKLKAAVAKLNKISYDKVSLIMTAVNAVNVVLPCYQYPICNQMNTWPPTFGDNSADLANCNKMYVNSYNLDVRLTQAGESDRIFYTAFIVSLKDEAADASTFDPLDGKLILQDGNHFQTLGTQGRVLLNPRMFNIHNMKRFTMGGRAGDQSNPETRELSFKVVPKQKLVINTRGNIFGSAASPNNGLTYPKDPSQNYYFLLFNDDSIGDFAANQITIGGIASVAIPS